MHLYKIIAATTALIMQVSPATHQVMVGQHGLAYEPDSIIANTGDQIEFYFFNYHHSKRSFLNNWLALRLQHFVTFGPIHRVSYVLRYRVLASHLDLCSCGAIDRSSKQHSRNYVRSSCTDRNHNIFCHHHEHVGYHYTLN
ncbi:hypothetical protein P7C71_g3237, partial [Lecanoromycetidae sp. Uapishka_2]